MNYDFFASDRDVQNRPMGVPTRITQLGTARAGDKGAKDRAREEYQSLAHSHDQPEKTPWAEYVRAARAEWLEPLGLWTPSPDFTCLPQHSAFWQLEFTLTRPYFSRDDDSLHVSDNPLLKDKVFKVPMVVSTSWKGSLRAAATRRLVQGWAREQTVETLARQRLRLTLLFGDEKGEEPGRLADVARYLAELSVEADRLYRQLLVEYFAWGEDALPHHAGRLYFYPTYFERLGLEVINPHDRRTRAGSQPIDFESVPAGATGVFSLLYVPFDRIGQDEAQTRAEVAADLPLVAQALQAMLTTYGFGAKTSSGFGTVRPILPRPGHLHVHGRATPYEFHALAKLADKTSLLAAARDAARGIAQGVTT